MKKTFGLGFLLLIAFLYTGCMFGGMSMMGMDHQNDHGELNSEKTISKELIISNYKLEAEFPAPQLHGEVNYTLQIYDRLTNKKLTQAEVWFEVISSSEDNSKDVKNLVSAKIELDKNGNYASSFAFHSGREVQIGFKIYSINDEIFSTPAEIFSIQKAVEEHSNNESSSSFNPLWIVGATVMVAMMFFVRF